MKAAVFAKPGFSSVSNELKELLNQFDTLLIVEDFSGSLFEKEHNNIERIESSGFARGYVLTIEQNVEKVLSANPDVIVSIGGDGMAAYIACALIEQVPDSTKRPKMIGWAAGTANVGPIVAKSSSTKLEDYKAYTFDAVEVSQNNKVLGYAFNDVIIGNTFLGTKDGQLVNLDALAMIKEGKQVVCKPNGNILDTSFNILLNGEKIGDSSWTRYKQICISSVREASMFAGRAVFGGMLYADGLKHPAVMTFTDRILVDSNPENWTFKGPVESKQICFDSCDSVVLSGFTGNAQIIIDGNPFEREGNTITVRNVGSAITVLRSDL